MPKVALIIGKWAKIRDADNLALAVPDLVSEATGRLKRTSLLS
jgi:hypothetical protein